MICRHCGANIKDGTKFCTNCGKVNINPVQQVKNQNSEGEQQGKKKNITLIVLIISIAVVLIVGLVVGGIILYINGGNSNSQNTEPEKTIVASVPVTETEATKYADVPDVVGLSKDDAISKILDSGFTYRLDYVSSDTVDSGYVVSQSPVGEKSMEIDSQVVIYVSKTSQADSETEAVILYCRASNFATLREVPSRSGTALAKIKTRESVKYLGTAEDFYYVEYNGKKGYVLMEFFSADSNAPLNYGTGNVE